MELEVTQSVSVNAHDNWNQQNIYNQYYIYTYNIKWKGRNFHGLQNCWDILLQFPMLRSGPESVRWIVIGWVAEWWDVIRSSWKTDIWKMDVTTDINWWYYIEIMALKQFLKKNKFTINGWYKPSKMEVYYCFKHMILKSLIMMIPSLKHQLMCHEQMVGDACPGTLPEPLVHHGFSWTMSWKVAVILVIHCHVPQVLFKETSCGCGHSAFRRR